MHPIDASAAAAEKLSTQMRLRSDGRSPETREAREARKQSSQRDRPSEGADRGVARAVLNELRTRLQLSDGDDDRDDRELTTARIARALSASLRSVSAPGDPVPGSLEAIEAGLAAAHRLLARRGLDSDEIERTLGEFREELADQIDGIAAQEAAPEPFELTALQAQVRRKESTTLELHTVDGDRVRIRIRNREELEISAAELNDGDLHASLLQVEQESRLRVKVDIDGSLSSEEAQAIQDLVTRAEQLAKRFFEADLEQAFELGAALDFDATQIADVRLRLSVKERFALEGIEASRPGLPPAPAPTERVEPSLGDTLGQVIDLAGPSSQGASLRLTPRSKLDLVIAAFDLAQPAASEPRSGFAFVQRLLDHLRSAAEAAGAPQPGASRD